MELKFLDFFYFSYPKTFRVTEESQESTHHLFRLLNYSC